MSPASFASTSASSLGSSKRSSSHRKFDTTEQLTPPTSASSPSSPWSSSPPVQKVLLAATIDRWIADMTSRIENDLMTDFFLTYRAFLSPLSLCKLLITRFEWALQPGHTAEDIAGRRIVRVRTYVVIRHWLLNYFHEDFVPDRELRVTLTAWLNRMGKDERLRPNPTDLRLIKSLKKVVKRLKAAYSTIGVDQAVDANNLIKTSLEADPLGNTRSRSNSMASVSSLQSIREEQSEPTTIAEIISSIAAPAMAQATPAEGNPAEKHLQRNDIRTSSSEDDVDLEIEMHLSGYDSDEQPRIPPIIPISPPRARHHSPVHQRKSRSPQLGSYERSPKALDGLPIIADNHRVSRAIASTVGSFSKLRRMMGNRQQRLQATGNTAPQYNLDISSDMDGKFGAIRMEANDVSPAGASLTRSVSGHPNGSDPSGLGIYNASSIPPLSESSASAASSSPDLRHSASSGTMRRKKSNPNMLSQIRPSGEASSLGVTSVQGLAPAATIRVSGIQLDDCDSSGDESNYGERRPLRTLRRLPAARDLRGGNNLGHNPLIHRHSIDSIASYATRRTSSCALEPIRIPSIATYDSNSSAQANDLDAMLDQGLVPFFVPPVDSEEEDEPGDVEAALRRLEGQVDDEKQRSNARKVEKYLKLSEEAKSNGGYVYGEGDDVSDEEDTTSSRAESVAVAVVGDDAAETAATADMPVAAEAQSQSRESVEAQHAVQSAQEAVESNASLMVPVEVPAKDAGKRTLQRKSSMRRFFGSTMSVSLWPMNSTASRQFKSKPQEPIYRSFLFSHKVDALARHFCIIERDLLEKVTWQELIGSSWRERLDMEDFTDWDSFMKMRAKLNSAVHEHGPPSQAHPPPVRSVGDVQTIIHRFNLMCRWIASESKSGNYMEIREICSCFCLTS